MGKDEVEASPEKIKKAVEHYLECLKHDPEDILKRFSPMYIASIHLRHQGMSESGQILLWLKLVLTMSGIIKGGEITIK